MSLPLSVVQAGFWFREALYGACSTLSFGLDATAPLSEEHLERALRAVYARHPLLRSRVAFTPRGLSLTIERTPGTVLTRLPDPRGSLEDWSSSPVSLRDWPLCRAAVADDRGGTHLRVVASHAVFDGASKDIFLADLLRAYRGEHLAPAPQAGHDAPFWRRYVERETCARAPRVHSGGTAEAPASNGSHHIGEELASLAFSMDRRALMLASATARGLSVSRFSVYLAAWHAALARTAPSTREVVTPIAVSTRQRDEAAEIGPFIAQVPVSSTNANTCTFRTLTIALGRKVGTIAADRLQRAVGQSATGRVDLEPLISYRRSASHLDSAVDPVLLPPLAAPEARLVIRMVLRDHTVRCAIDCSVDDWELAQRLRRSWTAVLRCAPRALDTPIGDLPFDDE